MSEPKLYLWEDIDECAPSYGGCVACAVASSIEEARDKIVAMLLPRMNHYMNTVKAEEALRKELKWRKPIISEDLCAFTTWQE